MPDVIAKAAKAAYAGAVTLVGTLAVTLTGNQNLGDVTTVQWLIVAGAVLSAVGGVYKITNRPAS